MILPSPVPDPLQGPQPLCRVLLRLGGPTPSSCRIIISCCCCAPLAVAAALLLGGRGLVVEAGLDDAVLADHGRGLKTYRKNV